MYDAKQNRYELMSYARCGRSGLELPRLSLGLWQNFGGTSALENGRERREAFARRQLRMRAAHDKNESCEQGLHRSRSLSPVKLRAGNFERR